MGHPHPKILARAVVCLGAVCVLVGCDRALVTGTVVTAEGEALPGVAVTFNDNPAETLSTGTGDYSAIVRAGDQQIRYSKSGFAPAEQIFTVVEGQSNAVPEVPMWRLPPSKGVYLYHDGHFAAVDGGEVREFVLEDGTAQSALRAIDEIKMSQETAPRIVCHNMPRFEARLSRLGETLAALRLGQEATIPVWVDTGSISVMLDALDAPEGLLLQVVLESPLEPGVYGLHWGALNRETALDPRVYVFAVAAALEEDASDSPADPPKSTNESEPTEH